MKTVIYLVRHAEAEGNVKRIFHGWTDSMITEKGHMQANKMAEVFKSIHVDVIYSSNLRRTIQTAEYIAALKKIPIILREGLREINGGDWECAGWDELSEKWPEEYYTWANKPQKHIMPNGETMEGFQKRLIKEIENIVGLNKGKDVCIVTHGTAIRSLLTWFRYENLGGMNKVKWQDNTAISKVIYDRGEYHIQDEGCDTHLGMELSTIKQQDWWKSHLKNLDEEN